MPGYVDFYCLPVPRKNLAAYKRLSRAWGKIMRDHGMLEYAEYVQADVKSPAAAMGTTSVEKLVKPRKGEVVIVSVVHFRSKAHRDRVNGAAYLDPRMAKFMHAKPLFDMKRMTLGEFKTLVTG